MATINICDICKSRENVNSRVYSIGSQTCPAGGTRDTIKEYFDLCQTCELEILRNFIKQLINDAPFQSDQFEINQKIVENIKEINK